MPSFQTIPQELRDSVIEYVILNERTPYKDLQHAEAERAAAGSSKPYRKSLTEYEEKMPRPNASALLLVNRAINSQTRTAVNRLYPEGLIYKMDVVVIDHDRFWPTWIHLPAFGKQPAKVEVDFRFFTSGYEHEKDGLRKGMGWSGGVGGPPAIYWSFYDLLMGFLEYGPAMVKKDHLGQQSRYSIRQVNIQCSHVDQYSHRDDIRRLKHVPQTTDRMMRSISSMFDPLVGMSYHTAKYCAKIYERLGSITFNGDGEWIKEYDLGSLLSSLNKETVNETFGELPREDRLAAFWTWKHQAVEIRKSLDLAVPEPIVWQKFRDLELRTTHLRGLRPGGGNQGGQ
jgi:hypothetical protein